MAFSFSSLCILLLCLVTSSHAWFFSGPRCNSKVDCQSCANHKSWSGQPCRWCPRNKECHAHGAVLTNPCSRSENVINPNMCNQNVTPVYDISLAMNMVYLSAAAYANNASSFIQRAPEVNSFHVVSQVTKPCRGNANCSGFVAVSHTERAIAIAFRGSENWRQILVESLQNVFLPTVSFETGGSVSKYFNDAFYLIWNQLKHDVYREIRRYTNYKVWVTGHSLGASLASLASSVLGHENRTQKNNLFLYTFGKPRVGDYQYASTHDTLVPISFRIVHFRDPVVVSPNCIPLFPAGPCTKLGLYHDGEEIFYNHRLMTKYSSYKKCQGRPINEDYFCSDNPSVWRKCYSSLSEQKNCINDHLHYFGIRLGLW